MRGIDWVVALSGKALLPALRTLTVCVTGVMALAGAGQVGAQVLDQVEVIKHETEADIVVHFARNLLYTKHVPLHEGTSLRIFFKKFEADLRDTGFNQERLWTQENGSIPKATVTFQRQNEGLLVEFSRSTPFKVRAGGDGRSVVITVPMAPALTEKAGSSAVDEADEKAAASSQILERVDLRRIGAQAEVVVRFTQKIQYSRHVAQPDGLALKVFVKPTKGDFPAAGFSEEMMWTPSEEGIPKTTVSFKSQAEGLQVAFSRPTASKVRAGEDGRSLVIAFPAPLPAAKPAPQKPVTPEVAAVVAPAAPSVTPAASPSPPHSASPSAVSTVVLPTPAPAAPTSTVVKPVAAAPTLQPQAALPLATPTTVQANAPSEPQMPKEEVEAKANQNMQEARQALAAKDGVTATSRLYRILGLPPNSQTEAAQALVGEARELKGELAKARAEYQVYLKLFPNGAHVASIKARLAALDKGVTPQKVAVPRKKAVASDAAPAEWKVSGSVSSYYYTGKSQVETLTEPPPGELNFNRETLSGVDQNSLITSINLNARRRDANTDMRVVIRDTNNQNFLDPTRSYNRLYSAYFERTDKEEGYFFRLGRQNPDGSGVLDRFDGVSGAYHLNPDWRAKAVYGNAVEFGSPFSKQFYGGSIERIGQNGVPGVNVYAIEQTMDGYLNRRAVGTELRYFDGHLSGYAMLDYDVAYKGLNIGLLQGNYLDDRGNNYFFMYDHRRAPSYSLATALQGAPGVSLNDLVEWQGMNLVRQQVTALSAISDMFSVGVTHPLNERWQVGIDYRRSSIGSTQPVTVVLPLHILSSCVGTLDLLNNTCVIDTAAMPASGVSHVVSLQATGNNLFVEKAVGVGNLSLIKGPDYKGTNLSLIYLLPLGEKWHLDTNLHFYTQRSENGDKQQRITPSLRLSYQWRENWFFEGEIGWEMADYTTTSMTSSSRRDYLYFGIRWDF